MTSFKKRMTAQLPPTPCTPEMREQIVAIAKREGRSIADLQRSAITLFLSVFDRPTNARDGITIK